MTTFALLSDVHLEVGHEPITFPPADCLLLAGDIVPLSDVYDIIDSPYKILSARIRDFFETVSKTYETVLWIPGNHEFYGGNIATAVIRAQKWLDQENLNNILLGNKISGMVGDVRVIGATLWTDYNKQDPVAMFDASRNMSDFREIENSISGCSVMLSPAQVYDIHVDHNQFITSELIRAQSDGVPAVVMTHHAPSTLSNQAYPHSNLTYAYCNTGVDHLFDYPGLRVWVHGHLHNAVDYPIHETRILSAPRGYVGFEKVRTNCVKTFVV